MKELLNYIFEAKIKKPSDVKKLKKSSRTEKVTFRDGDVYDMHDDGYEADFTYYSSDGDGYIISKETNKVYDVIIKTWSDDCGRIAGGTYHESVTIKNVDGKGDIHLSGYAAIFSKAHGENIISDIKAGNYLEDYVAKNWDAISYDGRDKWKYLKDAGDENAKSYSTQKEESDEQKQQKFNERYLQISRSYTGAVLDFKITKDGIIFPSWLPIGRSNSKELGELSKKQSEMKYGSDEYKLADKEIKELSDKLNKVIYDIVKPYLLPILEKVFKTKNLSKFVGLYGSFTMPHEHTMISKRKWGDIVYAIDTKDKKLVKVSFENKKVIDTELKIELNDDITIAKNEVLPEMKQLFIECSKAWKKQYMKQTEYVNQNYLDIWNNSRTWTYGEPTITKGEAKEKAVNDYKRYVLKHDFERGDGKISYSLTLLAGFIKGDVDPNLEPIEQPLENPVPVEKKERGKDTKLSASAMKDAGPKMDAWHEGTRKQNVGAMSDAKLKMNYKVCQAKGYDKEMGILKAEADKRGIVIESFTYKDFTNILNEELC